MRTYSRLEDALADGPAVAVVANPTSLHVQTARAALAAGANVLLEKPVAADLASARSLLEEARRSRSAISVAYCFRYHPLYRRLREAVAEGRLGRPFHLRTWQASYLPGWHPWEDYRTSYAARADLGGGVVRTLDHDLDMIRWILGQPTQVLASASSLAGLGLGVEDTADMVFRLGSAQANVHVCFGRRDYSRGLCVTGEQGSAELDWNAGSLTIRCGNDVKEIVRLSEGFDLNDVYLEMTREALAGLAADPPRPAVDLAHGVAALEMALGALESSKTGRAVQLVASSPFSGRACSAFSR